MKLGNKIRGLRAENKISQKALAEQLGISVNTLISYEVGKVLPPGHILVKLVEIFHVSSDYLLGLADSRLPYGRGREFFLYDEKEISVIKDYRILTDEEKVHIAAVIKDLSKTK